MVETHLKLRAHAVGWSSTIAATDPLLHALRSGVFQGQDGGDWDWAFLPGQDKELQALVKILRCQVKTQVLVMTDMLDFVRVLN